MTNCRCKCGCANTAVAMLRLWTACFDCGAAWLDGARKHGPGAPKEAERVAEAKRQLAEARR